MWVIGCGMCVEMLFAYGRRLQSSSSSFPSSNPPCPSLPLLPALHTSPSRAFPLLLVLDGTDGPGMLKICVMILLVVGLFLFLFALSLVVERLVKHHQCLEHCA